MKKIILILILLTTIITYAEIGEYADASTYAETNFTSHELNINLDFNDQKYFWIQSNFSLQNDDKYRYEPWQDVTMFGYYYLLKEGYVGINLNENTEVEIGQIIPKDEIESKYSLFFNDQTEIGKYSVNFKYENDSFYYKSNWMLLNKDSALEFQDRGMNYKTYGLKTGDFRIGLQDVILYKDRSFDPYYFLNPFPSTMIQEIRYTYTAPWVQKEEIVDDSAIIGLFAEYKKEKSDYFLQLFVDDLNLNRIFDPESYQNPDKLAWSIGTTQNTNVGTFGFYHAGATKYTSQRTRADRQTEYTYYPSSEYYNPEYDSEIKILDYKENYIGYPYGENSISFLVDYSNHYKITDNYLSLEYAISGEKSPHVPWGTDEDHEGTQLLNDDVLEHFVELYFQSTINVTNRITIIPGVKINHYTNKIELVPISEDSEYKIWRPIEDNDQTNFELSIKFQLEII